MLVIEIDGDYHDYTGDGDIARDECLKSHGWKVLRFGASEVETSAEDVAIAIANILRLDYVFLPRAKTGSGSLAKRKRNPR